MCTFVSEGPTDMTFLIESIVACAVFTLFVFLMSRNPVKRIFNYPPAAALVAGIIVIL